MYTQNKSTWREYPPSLAREGCTICQGTGWRLSLGSRLSRAQPCQCRELYKLLRLREGARIPKRYERCSLEGFVAASSSQERALAQAQRFADRYPKVDRGLFFTGEPGVGKTHLAVGILQELLHRFHEDVLFADFESLLSTNASQASAIEGSANEWARLRAVTLLVLDNFGMAPASPQNLRPVQELIQTRLARKRLTIYTGTGFRCREMFSGMAVDASSPAQAFLSAFPLPFLMEFLRDIKIVSIRGSDFRLRSSGEDDLFA